MRATSFLLGLLVLLLMCGCASDTRTIRVEIPPRVNLAAYPMIGLVTFSSNVNGQLDQLATTRFLTELEAAQPGTRVVELGSEADVLGSVHSQTWDPQTLRAIKASRGVDAIILGKFNTRRRAPDVHLSTLWKSLSVRQDVDAALTGRLIETATGATVWTHGEQTTAQVAGANLSDRGGSMGASDMESTYGQMVRDLACRVTDDFRAHYELRRVPKDEIVVASTDPRAQ